MTDEMKNLILQYVDSVQKIYGTHLKQVILYGSYGRYSDVDLMILVDLNEEVTGQFSDELSELGFEYNVGHDIWMMPIVKNIQNFFKWSAAYPFYRNVKEEGVSLYEAA